MMRYRFITNLIRRKAILKVIETNVCAMHDKSIFIQIVHRCAWFRIIFYGELPGYVSFSVVSFFYTHYMRKINYFSKKKRGIMIVIKVTKQFWGVSSSLRASGS